MNSLSAKQHFQKAISPEVLASMGEFFNNSVCRSAMIPLTAAMSENGCSQEQIKGAIIFRESLLNIAEVVEPQKPLPVKNLKEVPDVRTNVNPPTTETK